MSYGILMTRRRRSRRARRDDAVDLLSAIVKQHDWSIPRLAQVIRTTLRADADGDGLTIPTTTLFNVLRGRPPAPRTLEKIKRFLSLYDGDRWERRSKS